MKLRVALLLVSACCLTLSCSGGKEVPPVEGTLPEIAADDWPWWRGPTFDGKSRDERAETKFSTTENVVWKTNVPGRGHASPVLWGERLFLTTADEDAKTQSMLALDRKTGKLLWDTVVYKGGFPRKYGKNTHASATPACDGERVYGVFVNHDGLHVTATDLKGKIVWQKEAGSFTSEHGYGSSPVLYRSLVIVSADSMKDNFLAALDRESGKVVWKIERKTTGKHGNYATPIVANLAGKPQLILNGMGETSSYDPETGKRLWWCEGPAEVTACTVAISDKLVFSTGGFPEKELLAIRADGKGDVTNSHIAWRSKVGVTYVPSPLYHDGRLYVVNDGGTALCYEAESGKITWQERLGGNFSSSPVLVGDRLYVGSEAGKVFVLKAGPKFELLATNDMGDGIFATPAVCGGRIYLRTTRTLYCIGK